MKQLQTQYILSIFETPPDENGDMKTILVSLIATCKSAIYKSFEYQIDNAYQIVLFDCSEQKWYDKEQLMMFVCQKELSVDAYLYAELPEFQDYGRDHISSSKED